MNKSEERPGPFDATIRVTVPAPFNFLLSEFLAQVEHGRWPVRDPRVNPAPIVRTE